MHIRSAKDVKNAEKQKKGDEKEISKLRDEIDAYKLKLKEEFGYSKQDINKATFFSWRVCEPGRSTTFLFAVLIHFLDG